MLTAEQTMNMAGWLDNCEDGLPDVGSLQPIKPEHNKPSKVWRATVLAKKQAVLDERNKHLPTNVKIKTGNSAPNKVNVVDKSYIE